MQVGRTVLVFGLGVPALAVVTACSSDRAYAPPGTVLTDSQISADVAKSAGNLVAVALQDQEEYASSAGLMPSSATSTASTPLSAPSSGAANNTTPAVAANPCVYSSSTGRWTCPALTGPGGLVTTRSYAFYDAAGVAMQNYDAAKTAKINYHRQTDGPVGDGNTFTGVTHQTGDETASGLLGKETTRIWDGVSVSADTNVHRSDNTSRRYAGVRIDSMQAVTYRQPRSRGDFPLSGRTIQIVNYAVSSGSKSRSVSRRVVTTYNGSSTALVQVGTVTCTLHLDTHVVDGCSGQ